MYGHQRFEELSRAVEGASVERGSDPEFEAAALLLADQLPLLAARLRPAGSRPGWLTRRSERAPRVIPPQ